MPGPPRPLLHAALGTGAGGDHPGTARAAAAGAVVGGAAGPDGLAAVAVAVAAATAVPPVRTAIAARPVPEPVPHWLLLRIPVGTAWSEEAAFRAALATSRRRHSAPRWGQLLQAGAFGLWHIADARSTGEPVIGTVLVTAAAGWVFGWLQRAVRQPGRADAGAPGRQ